MKKYLLILILFVIQLSANAEVFDAKISFNWETLGVNERTQLIETAKNTIGSDIQFDKNEFKQEFAEYLKDVDSTTHYIQAQNRKNETSKYKIAGFFKGRILYMYGIQYKNDLTHIYYYDVLGNLQFVDIYSESYPNYPFYSRQFNKQGKLVAAYYYSSHDVQYAFDKKMKFLGVWVNNNYYNLQGKCVLKRSNY